MARDVMFSHPRTGGKGGRQCRVCGNRGGMIRTYGLDMCRQCFKQYAETIGFRKYN
ncbi:MAG: 40S ribosomal protein S29 [Amphiamblys sp. WSBS2006]|nr:MAG: 40S ribosomal protein S29 [Amphiamblys sp. WSBS2006]